MKLPGWLRCLFRGHIHGLTVRLDKQGRREVAHTCGRCGRELT